MNSPARCRWILLLPALLAAAYVLGLLSSTTEPLNTLVIDAPTAAAGLAFAAGSRGGGGGTPQSHYQSKCATCHGAGGKGNGWTAWLFRLKVRDLTDAAYMRSLPDDYLFQIIKQGGASLGKPGMPSWGQELTDQEIRNLVVHIRGFVSPLPRQQPAGVAR